MLIGGLTYEITQLIVEPSTNCNDFCGQLNLTGIELNKVCMCHKPELNCSPSKIGSLYLICGGEK
jgi:hypothetical protein